ncbi:unnamed protein product [Schistosoma mattheei]|uniref:Trichohyalin-plectin-homology domain-containing protein n=1 Tax=Schistosoma mattheei TaxID=31246 RepID=A0A3P8F5M6_9TREM|nr:unnamed protein product [Schistosoma mattheei]
MKNAQTNEEARLNRATTEKEEKYQRDTKEKYDKQLKIIQEINEYRVNEIERRRKRSEDEKQIELCEIRGRIAAELALTEYENACKTKKLEERKQLSRQLLQESHLINFCQDIGFLRECIDIACIYSVNNNTKVLVNAYDAP